MTQHGLGFSGKLSWLSGDSGREKMVSLTYILGIALIISAVIYFFAANWSGFGRETKVALIALLVAGFYIAGVVLGNRMSHHPLIGKLFLLAGTVSFGAAVALIGQIYNSHANSYTLFAIWFVPALLMSIVTRFRPFDVLAYILFHLAAMFYIFPTAQAFQWPEGWLILHVAGLAVLNAVFFFLLAKKKFTTSLLLAGSFVVFHGLWLFLTVEGVSELYYQPLNITYIAIFAASFFIFIKVWKQRIFTAFTGVFLGIYVLQRVIRFMFEINTSSIFILVLFFAAALVAGNIFLIRKMRTKRAGEGDRAEGSQDREALPVPVQHRAEWVKVIVTGIISVVSAWLAVGAITGLTSLFTTAEFPVSLFAGSALVLTGIAVWQRNRLDDAVKQPLVFTGLILTMFVAWEMPFYWAVPVIAILPFAWKSMNGLFGQASVHILATLFILIYIASFDLKAEVVAISMLAVHILLTVAAKYFPEKEWSSPLYYFSLFFAAVYAFALTFMTLWYSWIYYSYNALFFIVATYLLYTFMKKNARVESAIMLLAWFVFVVFKYYDYVWLLLHKSIALALTGAVFLAAAFYFDRKNRGERIDTEALFRRKAPVVVALLVLQLGFIGFQFFQSEQALAEGDLIKLELEPVDPRSLLQGDYMQLQYTISQDSDWREEFNYNEKIQVVLTENDEGFHEYAGVYIRNGDFSDDYELLENDVILTGKSSGYDMMTYGIEHFFFEEGTGADFEDASMAWVRVSSEGDAILVSIE